MSGPKVKGLVDNSLSQKLELKNKEQIFFAEIGSSITVNDFQKKTQYKIFSFIEDDDKREIKSPNDDLVFRCHDADSVAKSCLVDTGNYVGRIFWPINYNKIYTNYI